MAAADFLDGLLAALDAKQPLLLALDWYQGFFGDYQQSGVLAMHPGDQVAGGHQVAVSGYTSALGGLVRCRNSWGATSPARTDLLPDSIAGDVFIPVAMLSNGVVVEVRAVTPAVSPTPPAPEQVTLAIAVPAGGQPGAPVTVQASVQGVTAGDTALVVWNWGDGTANGAGLTAAHVWQTPGNYSVQAMAVDSQTGAHSAVMAATIAIAAPAPGPTPGPLTLLGGVLNLASGTVTFRDPSAHFLGNMSDGSTVRVP